MEGHNPAYELSRPVHRLKHRYLVILQDKFSGLFSVRKIAADFLKSILDKMKIAIPTDDGLTLSKQFSPALAYLVLTVELGEIVHQEMRRNKIVDPTISEFSTFNTIRDCGVVMVKSIGQGPEEILRSQQKEIITTGETIVTSAVMHYLGSSLRKEANSCCCP
jgi:predicted Fe-Mo cluster-binding NifX family protein